MGARFLIVALAALAALASCERTSKLYCERNQDPTNCPGQRDAVVVDVPVDAKMCSGDPDCTPDRCDLVTHTCVQCLSNTDCMAPTAFCDLTTNTCRGCLLNSDCASQACLPDGSCGDDTNVAYVMPGNGVMTGTCPLANPCTSLAVGIGTNRPFVKLMANDTEGELKLAAPHVTIIADPGTTLTHTGGGNAFTLSMNGGAFAIYDLTIDATPSGNGVEMGGMNSVTLQRVKIHDCKIAVDATAGYIQLGRSELFACVQGLVVGMAADYDVTNNFIYGNGNAASGTTAAVQFATTLVKPTNRFELNTVVDNHVKNMAGLIAGVQCMTAMVPMNDDLIAHNDLGSGYADTGALCDVSKALVSDDLTMINFVSQPSADYRLQPPSIAIDHATGASTVTDDFFGKYRPYNNVNDYGAHEYRP